MKPTLNFHTKIANRNSESWRRLFLILKANNTCAICNEIFTDDMLVIDHIYPLSRGGTNDISNLQVLCKSCNLYKIGSDKAMPQKGIQVKFGTNVKTWNSRKYLLNIPDEDYSVIATESKKQHIPISILLRNLIKAFITEVNNGNGRSSKTNRKT